MIHDVYFASEDAAGLGWDVPAVRFRSARRLINGHLLLRIRGIREREYAGPVHDLDVDGDDLFAAPFALTHNCDPPYPASTRGARWATTAYAHELTDADHRRLAETLHALRGLAVVSGYPCPLYRDLYARLAGGHPPRPDQRRAGGHRGPVAVAPRRRAAGRPPAGAPGGDLEEERP